MAKNLFAGVLQGIIGQTYATAASNAVVAENDFKFHGVEADFEMESLFTVSHAKSVFGKASGTKARKLIEVCTFSLLFPLCILVVSATSCCFSLNKRKMAEPTVKISLCDIVK